MSGLPSESLQECLDRLRQGDSSAREALLRTSQQRLLLLTRKMLRQYPGVRRWEETDDVFQQVLVRLDRMLDTVPVTTVRDYLRLAAMHIRHVLIDLARHYYGPQGLGAHHATPPGPLHPLGGQWTPDNADSSGDPGKLAAWGEFHERIQQLPDEQREVFDLLWYHGLTQEEAAELLRVSLSTVKRRWLTARVKLADSLGGEFPE